MNIYVVHYIGDGSNATNVSDFSSKAGAEQWMSEDMNVADVIMVIEGWQRECRPVEVATAYRIGDKIQEK